MDADTAMWNISSFITLRNFNSLTDSDMSSDDNRPLLISITTCLRLERKAAHNVQGQSN